MTTRDGINATLKIIGYAGLAGLVVTAPNAAAGVAQLLDKKTRKKTDHNRLLTELKRQNLVYITKDEDNFNFKLSHGGALRLQKLNIDELEIPRPKKWDKKWRVVSFDVPVKYSKQRAAFALHLRSLGFVLIQKSVWVHPWPSFKEVEFLAGYYNILRYCAVLEVSKLDEPTTGKLLNRFRHLLST